MRTKLIGTIVAVLTSTAMASAGDKAYYLNSASEAVAQAQSGSQSQAVAQGGSVTFVSPASTSSRIHQTYGTQTIRSAPQVVAPSMSSGHPCAYAPLSVGVSVIGFGGAFGGQRIDDACLLAQMGIGDASMVMIAQRNPRACRALESVGRLAPGACGGRAVRQQATYRPARTVAPRPAVRRQAALPPQVVAPPAPRVKAGSLQKVQKKWNRAPIQKVNGKTILPVGSVKCLKNKSGKVVRVEHWARVTASQAKQACRKG